jgi:cytochrome P450
VITDYEIVSLCSEFLNAGTNMTSTGLQWIMAELVKNSQKSCEAIYSVTQSIKL